MPFMWRVRSTSRVHDLGEDLAAPGAQRGIHVSSDEAHGHRLGRQVIESFGEFVVAANTPLGDRVHHPNQHQLRV